MSATALDKPSLLHRIDPLPKFLIVLCISTLAVAFPNLVLLVILVLICAVLAAVSKISSGQLWGYIKPFLYLVLVLVIVQAVFYPFSAQYVLIRIPAGSPILGNYVLLSVDSLVYGVTLGLRFVALMLSATVFSLTTKPRDFLLSMHRIHVPYTLTFMVNIALRFIPDIRDKAKDVMLAQTARGLELEKGSIITKVRAFLPLLLPLLVTYLLMARNSAVVLETRAFRYKKERTYMHAMKLTRTDTLLVVSTLALTILCGTIFWQYGALLRVI
ncbi:MAG: energy-coupling factor transporter transmembrane component T [Candidatus Bathyarchaeia archaeon]|jgi:energy-coupling factor transport system permease protein